MDKLTKLKVRQKEDEKRKIASERRRIGVTIKEDRVGEEEVKCIEVFRCRLMQHIGVYLKKKRKTIVY